MTSHTFFRWANKIATWVGDRAGFGEEETQGTVCRTTSDIYPLHAILPYETYDAQIHLFSNQKSIGFMLESTVLTGSHADIESILSSIVTDIVPAHADFQIWLWASPKVEHIFQHFVTERTANRPDLMWLAQERIQFFKKGVFDSLLSG